METTTQLAYPAWCLPNGHVRPDAMTDDGRTGEAKAEHASVVKTIPTKTGQLTLIVNDDSHWKASALAVICESALQDAMSTLAGMQHTDIDPRPAAPRGGEHV